MNDKIIHKELSYQINGCIYDVHNEIGPGVREECYQKALEHRLALARIPFLAKPATRRELVFRGTVVDCFEPDLVVAEQVVLELKHQQDGFCNDNFTQILTYLKFWNMRLGLLVNFAMDRAHIRRVPYDPRLVDAEEDYSAIPGPVRDEYRSLLSAIRDGLIRVHGEFGLGYVHATYRRLAMVEFGARGLRCDGQTEVTPEFREWLLPHSSITPLVVDDTVCVEIQAVYDEITARAIRTLQTHLRLTGCKFGLIASFGRERFIIRGVRP